MKKMPASPGLKTAIMVFCFIFLPGILQARHAALPITIDYTLLKSIMISQLFNGPENKIELAGDSKGCTRIVISNPAFSEENSVLRFEIKVHITASFDLASRCFIPFEWEGYVVFFQTPVIDPETWSLSFQTRDSIVLDNMHNPRKITGVVWKLIKGDVHDFVDDIRVDLAPVVDDIKSLLTDMFPEEQKFQIKQLTDSMTPGTVDIRDQALHMDIDTNISSVYDPARLSEEKALNDEELSNFIGAWETMDAYIVYMISALIDRPLDENGKDLLLETLLETRYRFIDELSRPVHDNNFVRNQFMNAWDKLSIIFKNHIINDPGGSSLRSLAFFSSMDALTVLDSIGPAIGIEISRDGLVRLARLLGTGKPTDLFYSMEINENLRQILGMGPGLKDSSKQLEDKEDHDSFSTDFKKQSMLLIRWLSFCSEAHATEQDPADTVDPKDWIPNQPAWFEYVKNIRQVLKTGSDQIISKSNRDQEYNDLFHLIVYAVAWQESCFRQFRVNKGTIEYLRSYNNTSVGLMQINERVWRGLYDQEKLRWNIYYNVHAGCEIADLYLNRYIFRKMKKNHYPLLEDRDNIARTLYALYNGGPGQFSKFLDRLSDHQFYTSDNLFYEKYLWVKNDQWEKARICLIGE